MSYLRHWASEKILDTLSGLEAGVLGGLLGLAWFMIFPLLLARPWWWIPNLLASKHFPAYMLSEGAGSATLTGSAIHLLICALAGAAAGLAGIRGRVAGPILAALLCLWLYQWGWRELAPLAPRAPTAVIAVGYFLFGSVLGWTPALRARLAGTQVRAH